MIINHCDNCDSPSLERCLKMQCPYYCHNLEIVEDKEDEMTYKEARQILLENFIVPCISDNTVETNQYNRKMQEAFNKAIFALNFMIEKAVSDEVN